VPSIANAPYFMQDSYEAEIDQGQHHRGVSWLLTPIPVGPGGPCGPGGPWKIITNG